MERRIKKTLINILIVMMVMTVAFSSVAMTMSMDDFQNFEDNSNNAEILATVDLIDINGNNACNLQIIDSNGFIEKEVNITNFCEGYFVDKDDLLYVYERAMSAMIEENVIDEHRQLNGTINYELITDDVTYFYEETVDGRAELFIMETLKYSYEEAKELGLIGEEEVIEEEFTSASSLTTRNTIPIVMVNLPSGIGGRLRISQASGSNIYCTVQTPTISQIQLFTMSNYNYVYTGFSSSAGEADIGLQYARKEPIGGWNHYFFMGSAQTGFVSGYDQVNNKNFFLTSDFLNTRKITLNTMRNYNNSGYVRSVAIGYARYSNANGIGTPGAYFLTSIIDYKKTVNSVNSWKILNTITPSENTIGLKSWCKFTNITIDGVKPAFATLKLEYDWAGFNVVQDSSGRIDSLAISILR